MSRHQVIILGLSLVAAVFGCSGSKSASNLASVPIANDAGLQLNALSFVIESYDAKFKNAGLGVAFVGMTSAEAGVPTDLSMDAYNEFRSSEISVRPVSTSEMAPEPIGIMKRIRDKGTHEDGVGLLASDVQYEGITAIVRVIDISSEGICGNPNVKEVLFQWTDGSWKCNGYVPRSWY